MCQSRWLKSEKTDIFCIFIKNSVMGTLHDEISTYLQTFMEAQPLFFVGTAAADGRVNVSPKGMDTFRVLGPRRVMWLNLTGSGNETAAHILANPRMTLMFCAFEGKPMILRLYGQARMYHEGDAKWHRHIGQFPAYTGARQLFELEIDAVQTSCGFAVPLMAFQAHRDTLDKWAETKGRVGIKAYWQEKNTRSLDGEPTDIVADP